VKPVFDEKNKKFQDVCFSINTAWDALIKRLFEQWQKILDEKVTELSIEIAAISNNTVKKNRLAGLKKEIADLITPAYRAKLSYYGGDGDEGEYEQPHQPYFVRALAGGDLAQYDKYLEKVLWNLQNIVDSIVKIDEPTGPGKKPAFDFTAKENWYYEKTEKWLNRADIIKEFLEHPAPFGMSKSEVDEMYKDNAIEKIRSELKSRFRKLSAQLHPDRGGDEELYKSLGEAYNALKDIYDIS